MATAPGLFFGSPRIGGWGAIFGFPGIGGGGSLLRLALAGWLMTAPLVGCRSQAPALPVAPPAKPVHPMPVQYTTTENIRMLAVGPDGALWAATHGGVLCWLAGASTPRRWTAADGLWSNDVRAVRPSTEGAEVKTTNRSFHIGMDGTIIPEPGDINPDIRGDWSLAPYGLGRDRPMVPWPMPQEALGAVTAVAETPKALYLATALDLWRRADGHWRRVALPPGSPASHVSALGVRGADLIAGLYGDGLYRLDGTRWERLTGTPLASRFATAIAFPPAGIAVGTRSEGVWQRAGGRWRPLPAPLSLPASDFQAIAEYGGMVWAATLDGGLLQCQGARVRRWTRADGLSADSPRGLAVFGNQLYVRHATGETDRYDGTAWHPAFTKADLPRPEVYALATDGARLCVGGWAGWAATDGRTWEQHYHDPQLAGQVVTAIAPAPDGAVWLGTQKQGLLRYQNCHYTRFQEVQGLTDDWITCLAVRGTRVLAGTYTGGLVEKQGDRFARILDPQGYAVRAVAFAPDGRALAATPLGVYREAASGKWPLLAPDLTGGAESQSLLSLPDGLWVGTRTALAFVPHADTCGCGG